MLDPAISAPEGLPIAEHWQELARLIEANQVVVVAGETGSGKSTQLPKLCLAMGRGVNGWIGHTQPRRIAARSVADRVAHELGVDLGGLVGATVRFNDRVGPDTRIRLMTDGILLAEIRRDRDLRRYDTLIIDEAHERSLNIDFLLGYLRRLLPRRPDLRVVITSATIDTARFSAHFDGAPIVEVSGRTYPVELRYRPLEDDATGRSVDQTQGICEAVEELAREGEGDVLVFLSGEREIRDTAEALERLHLQRTEIVPLYARLSLGEQQRVFRPHSGRRIVLATNVAETSLTVPGIRAVIDPGTARVSRFNHRTKTQRLPIEAVSQASADQRAGRCGRVGPGVCIRLYSEQDYASRPPFTEPEIQRTNLASVVLAMASLGLGRVEEFPFVDPPDHRPIRDGIALLEELGALDPAMEGRRGWLTPMGRRLARLPLDPRLARMVLEAERRGCLAEVTVIAAALSIQDPRERPTERLAQANECHNRFKDPHSDFLAYLNLWRYLHEEHRERSSSGFRRLCRVEFLNYLRVREWQDLVTQIKRTTRDLGLEVNHQPASADDIHRSLLAGLLSHSGQYDEQRREYVGARSARWAVARGSVRFRTPPRWAMAAELVETNRLWGRTIAPIRPEWLEELGGHLLNRSFGDIVWDAERGAAVTDERVSLYGMVLVAGRRINVATVDPAVARRWFIRRALVQGEWHRRHRFVAANEERIAEIEALEERARRRDLLVDDETLEAFFSSRVPEHVTGVGRFDRWWRAESRRHPNLLELDYADLIRPGSGFDPSGTPDVWRQADLELPLEYRFDPGAPHDGLTVIVPIEVLNRVDPAPMEWLVPAWRTEMVEAVVRGLPKAYRKQLLPVAQTVDTLIDRIAALPPGDGPAPAAPVSEVLCRELGRLLGSPVAPSELGLDRLPPHLRPTFRVVAEVGTEAERPLAEGPDLSVLRSRLEAATRRALAGDRHPLEVDGLTDWAIGTLPRVLERDTGALRIVAYPAVCELDGRAGPVGVRLCSTESEQIEVHWAGVRRLLRTVLPNPAGHLARGLDAEARLALVLAPVGGADGWIDDVITAAADLLLGDAGGPPWTEQGWGDLRAAVTPRWARTVLDLGAATAPALGLLGRVQSRLVRLADNEALAPAVADARAHVHRLVYPGCLTAMGAARAPDLPRYLRALDWRLGRLPEHHRKDREAMVRCRRVEGRVDEVVAAHGWAPELEEAQWLLEELRVQSFAQHLGTPVSVSEARVLGLLDRFVNSVRG